MSNESLVKKLRVIALLNRGVSEIYIEKAADEIERLEGLLAEAREEGRIAGLREAKEIINNLTKNRTKEDFYPDAYDCRDAITRAAEGMK